MIRPILAALLVVAPAFAERPPDDPYAVYVRARVADDLGALDTAAAGFAAAAAADPADATLSLRAFRQAVTAGDMPLALRVARALDARGALPPDGALLLLSDAIAAGDWRRAGVLADRVETEKLFAFLVPTIRAWIAVGSGRGDPLRLIGEAQASPLAAAYLPEHRALLLLVTGRTADGVAAIEAMPLPPGARTARLRIAAAAALAMRRDRAGADAMLTGGDAATLRARALLDGGAKLPGAIFTARDGVAELFVRVAADINREQSTPLAIEFARMATLLAPGEAEPWLVTASLLAGGGDDAAALAALAHVGPDDPFVGSARDARVALLLRDGRAADALGDAREEARSPQATSGDWARLGDVQAAQDEWTGAAASYGRATALAIDAAADTRWPLLLQQANAELRAGDWPAARRTARDALAIAPDQPAVLNFLGYSELDHGEDIGPASALIAKAAALAPDDAAIADSLGWSWYVRGDLARAIPLLERAAQAAPAEVDINDHLGDAYWRAGRRTEARYAWRAALIGATGAEAAPIRAKLDRGPGQP